MEEILEVDGKLVDENPLYSKKILGLQELIYDLVNNVYMVTKEQLWFYFHKTYREQDVSIALRSLYDSGNVYVLHYRPDSEGVEEGAEDKHIYAQDRIVPDITYLDASMFTASSYEARGMTKAGASRAKFLKHVRHLEACRKAFQIFLDLKEQFDASEPMTMNSTRFPFIILTFQMRGQVYEILNIREGEETNLIKLKQYERYEERDIPVRIVMVDSENQFDNIRSYEVKGIKSFVLYDSERDQADYIPY